MDGMADGAIIIDTKLDTAAIGEAIKELNATVKKFVDNFEKQFGGMDKAVEKSAKSVSKMKIAPTTEGIEEATRSLDVLNHRIEAEKAILNDLRISLERNQRVFGATAERVLELGKKVATADMKIDKMIRTSTRMSAALNEAEDAMKDGGGAAENLGDKSGKAEEGLRGGSKGADKFQVALGNLISRGIEKAISALADLSKKTFEYRQDMAMLAQNAKDSGVGLGFANDAVKYLNGTTNDLSGSLEAVNSLMSTGLKENQMVAAVEALSGAVARFPGTYSIDTLAASLQETIKSGKATEQFAELLGRSGQNVGDFNKKMAHARSESQKTNIVMQALAKTGLADTSREYRVNNKALVDAADAQYDYNGALATLGAVMQPISTEIMREFTKILVDNKGEISSIISVLSSFVRGLTKLLDIVLQVPSPLLFIGFAIGAVVLAVAKFSAATLIASKVIAGGTKALANAAPAAVTAGSSFALLALEVTAVATAISLVIGSLAMLVSAINGVPSIMINSTFEAPSKKINAALASVGDYPLAGYARGTLSASPGLHWVGEHGPELLDFKGGEVIHNATQSLAMGLVAGSSPVYQTDNFYINIDPKNIKEFNDIVRIAQNRKSSIRMGYVKG